MKSIAFLIAAIFAVASAQNAAPLNTADSINAASPAAPLNTADSINAATPAAAGTTTNVAPGAAGASTAGGEGCDPGYIRSNVLKPNGTEWLTKCAAETQFNILEVSTFLSKEESKKISANRYCVDALNQINTFGQQGKDKDSAPILQCTLNIQGQKKTLSAYINAVLEGRATNSSDADESASASGSLEILDPEDDSLSGSDVGAGSDVKEDKKKDDKAGEKSGASSLSAAALAGVAAIVAFTMN